jgi:hypothetical protein
MRCTLILTLTCAMASSGCGPAAENEPTPEPSYSQATLTSQGFDFSSGAVPTEGALADTDGEVINWAPYPTLNTSLSYLEHLWLHPALNDDEHNYTRDMGAVAMSEVTALPDAWDAGADETLAPIAEGHVYVIKCADGHAKLKVRALRGDAWELDVDYHFTAGESFDK